MQWMRWIKSFIFALTFRKRFARLIFCDIDKRKVPAKDGTFLFFFHTKLTFKTKVSQNLERYTKMMYNRANIKNGRRSKYEFNV